MRRTWDAFLYVPLPPSVVQGLVCGFLRKNAELCGRASEHHSSPDFQPPRAAPGKVPQVRERAGACRVIRTDPREAIHTLARQHCMAEFQRWSSAYQHLEERGGRTKSGDDLDPEYSGEAYATFPRYLVWQAILDEVERFNAHDASDVDSLRRKLIDAGFLAESPMTRGLPAIANAAMNDERAAFRTFVESTSANQIADVTPIPARRVMAKSEVDAAWARLKDVWIVDGQYWWSLRYGTPPGCGISFHTDWFSAPKVAVLRSILLRRGVSRIFELREFGEWGSEQETESLDPVYTGEEGYWFSSRCDWLVYASHESSVTLAGDWLVRDFKNAFPECDEYTYGGPFSTADARGTWKWPVG